ncbi:thioredoxin family protein [Cohnella faecalis]|uniref:Thioredoxin n=1 Tax=Cohnella faecalis TaxID=2315694 RepID=A0A398CIX4_9BACL|nr:thioredoxin family protein [Cohnella faecalis]RIE02673.1 thioredoxin [Cohnella faecalis]
MAVLLATDADFDSKVKREGITLVDFGAKWCPPCKALEPIMDELDALFGGDIDILKVDVEQSPHTASTYGVFSMPTVILFKDGEPMEKKVGLKPRSAYEQSLAKYREDVRG